MPPGMDHIPAELIQVRGRGVCFEIHKCVHSIRYKEEVPQQWKKSVFVEEPTRCHLFYLLYFLDTQHVSGINMSIFRSLRLCC